MKYFWILAIVGCFLVSPVHAKPTESHTQSGEAKVGSAIPRLVGYPLGGTQPFTSDSYFTKIENTPKGVAYVVFATWCKPCIKGIDELAHNAARLDAAKVKVVLLNMQEDYERVNPWVMSRNLPKSFLVILDEWGTEAGKLGVKKSSGKARLPLTVVTNASGKVTAIFGEEGPDYVDQVIKAASR